MKIPAFRVAAAMAVVFLAIPAAAQTCSTGGCAPYGAVYGGYAPTAGESCKNAFWQNMIWPKQYVRPARRGICQSFETMVNNGWRRQNLLDQYHFEADGAELSEAGQLKARWILTQAPAQRRNIFVGHGVDAAQTADRIGKVHEYAATLGPHAAPASVQETHIRDHGRPAGAVDNMFTDFAGNQWTGLLEGLETSSQQ
ncbi:MAG: hypothetical protein AAF961_05130 [Planctomycetota bacterium]